MTPETFKPKHFKWVFKDGIAHVSLDRPERKNPLTFDSYAELARHVSRAGLRENRFKVGRLRRRMAGISARAATSTTSSAR